MRRLLISLLPIVFFNFPAQSQSLVMNGYYDCQRATNGRPYCKKQGAPSSAPYAPVGEDFFASYEGARTGRQPTVNVGVGVLVANNVLIIQLKEEVEDLKAQSDVLEIVIGEQKALLEKGDPAGVLKDTVSALNERLAELRTRFVQQKEKLATAYSSPIKPDDAELGITARKSSETFPKVPFFIPGTRETGEFWVEPVVSDTGSLFFKLKFVDAGSTAAEKVRSTLEMSSDQLEKLQRGLIKVASNAKVAHEKKVRRSLDVRIECFPSQDCPGEGKKVDGKSSTELIFLINDDGSTSGRIQRNKGRFEEGYNFSVKTALLFQAYVHHVLSRGKTELEVGSATNDELKGLFR